jgi:hypothetical protein
MNEWEFKPQKKRKKIEKKNWKKKKIELIIY